MDFEEFKTKFLLDLEKGKRSCIKTIDKNKTFLQTFFADDTHQKEIDNFVHDFNELLLPSIKFKYYEKALKHPVMAPVYKAFQNSTVFIDAVKKHKRNLLKWLQTMRINLCVRDEDGMTALMHAVQRPLLRSTVKYLLKQKECINVLDKNQQNAYFYALDVPEILEDLVTSDININQPNIDHDTIFLHCCKTNKLSSISILLKNPYLDANAVDGDERTAAMYLAEKGHTKELYDLKRRNCDYNFVNSRKESVLSHIIQKLYISQDQNPDLFLVIAALVQVGCNFNQPVDEEGNTALMASIITGDLLTADYIVRKSPTIDLSVKNNFGESATSLLLKSQNFDRKVLITFKDHPTFEIDYVDPNNHNTPLHLMAMTADELSIKNVVENNINILNGVNSRQENALIVATKSHKPRAVQSLLECGIFVDHQDDQGNTALYYAVDQQDLKMIKLLRSYHANTQLQNREGVSPLDRAHQLDVSPDLLQALTEEPSAPPLTYPASHSIDPTHEESQILTAKEKYPETAEYLYPCISNRYPPFKIDYYMDCVEKHVYATNNYFLITKSPVPYQEPMIIYTSDYAL